MWRRRRSRTPPIAPTAPPWLPPSRRLAIAAQAHPQRADQADENGRLRRELRLRSRRARGVFRPGLLPRGHGTPAVLRPARARLRARDQEAAGVLGKAAEGAGISMGRF